MSVETFMAVIPACNINPDHGPAYADARLPHIGAWAYLCRACFDYHQCELGTGSRPTQLKERQVLPEYRNVEPLGWHALYNAFIDAKMSKKTATRLADWIQHHGVTATKERTVVAYVNETE